MRKAVLLWACGVLLAGGASFAQESRKDEKGPPMHREMSPESRKKMADAHEKMAACLRSDKPFEECHYAMMKDCREAGGKEVCMGGMPGGKSRPPKKE